MTGSRGKSSVTRLIASSLREAGFRVLAKTTGSKPVVILPDGREEEIERKGQPSILEEKKILKIGAKLEVQALVVELMSVQPECMSAESVQMIKPHVLVVTNVRLDHLNQMGSTKEEIAQSLASSIPAGCTVFIPEEECFPVFKKVGERVNSKIICVGRDSEEEELFLEKYRAPYEFEENLRLAHAVGEFLGIKREHILQGMKNAQPDFGSLKVWKADAGSPPRRLFLVSAFAANDPESTRRVLSKVEKNIPFKGKKIIGLLNLRSDRGDRTLQWLNALNEESFRCFQKIALVGGHAQALRRRLSQAVKSKTFVCKEKLPQKIMSSLLEDEEGEVLLVGMGNMGGYGRELVSYWQRIGSPYGF